MLQTGLKKSSEGRAKTTGAARASRSLSIANRHRRLQLDRRQIQRVIDLLDASADRFLGGCPPGELSLVFLTDPALARLHADFLGDPTPTDVITFEGQSLLGTAGEVCVSADMAATYARRHGSDFARELTLYLVHGWLHLAGYDDLQPARKRRMRAAEARAMGLLEAANAIPALRLRK